MMCADAVFVPAWFTLRINRTQNQTHKEMGKRETGERQHRLKQSKVRKYVEKKKKKSGIAQRLFTVATSVPSQRIFSKPGKFIKEGRNWINSFKLRHL